MTMHIPTSAETAARRERLGILSSRVATVTSPILARAREIAPIIPEGDPFPEIYDKPVGPPHLVGSQIRVRFILHGVSERSGFSECDLISDRRISSLVWARYEAIYLVKATTTWSLPQIGRFFHRDHTSVMNALRQYEARLTGKKYIRKEAFAAARKLLGESGA
jgi:hypothetical protein